MTVQSGLLQSEFKGIKIKYLAFFLAFVIVLAGIKGYQIYNAIKNGAFTPPPEAVTSAVAAESSWEATFDGVGSLAPIRGATLSAEEAGKIVQINFDSGTQVQEGAVLVAIDTTVEEANLKGAVAMKSRMLKAFERAQALRQKNAISNDEYDQTAAQYQQSVAQADALDATIKRKRIVAPFAGIAGIRTVNVGQYVSAGTQIVPLYAMDSLFINFSVPQQLSSQIALGQKIALRIDAASDKSFEGTVTAINPNIDEASRNLSIQGIVKNTGELKPGMFASVSLSYGEPKSLVTIPVTSVQYAPYGDTVYVIEKKGDGQPSTVKQQIVKVGPKKGDQVAILSGIQKGEEVVTSGLFKLRPGAAVSVNNTVTPSSSANPKPQDT